MTKRNHWRLFFSIVTAIFMALIILNISDLLYFHPSVTEGSRWGFDKKTQQIFIEKIYPGKPAQQAGIQPGDTLSALNGTTFHSGKAAWNYLSGFKPGDHITYTIKRGENKFNTDVILQSYTQFIPLSIISTFVGLLFLIIGFIVAYKKPFMRIPRLFYYFSFTFFLIIGFNSITNTDPWRTILETLQLIGVMVWAPSVLHFFMNFPQKIPLLHKHPKIIYLIYLPSILIAGYVGLFNQKLRILLSVVIIIYMGFAFANLSRSKHKITNPHEKKSIRLIYWAMVLGLIPLGILSLTANWVVEALGLLPVSIVFVFTGLVPIAFGYSIMRYGLMDVEIIIKKSLIYTLITTSFIMLYFLVVIGMGGFIVRYFGISSETANLIFLAVVALAFQPIRTGIQNIIDRRFYRDRYEYQKTLLKLSQELPGLVNIQDVLKRVCQTISDSMHVAIVMVHLYEDRTGQYQNRYSIGIDTNHEYNWQEEKDGLIDLVKKEKNGCLFYKIEEDERYNNLPMADKVKIEKLGIVLSVPMFYQNSLIGIISLGQKQSGQVYNQEDMDLLQTVAGNTAIALINGRLHQEDLRKQRFENELILARHIQTRLLPEKDPDYPNWEIVGISKPATIVGGDYYDYIPVSENRLFIFVGDVSGKGMPAALYMSKVQGMIQVASGIYRSPQKLLIDINRHLYYGMERKYFVTMLGALVEVRQKKISFCRAGHTPVLIKRENGVEKVLGSGIGLGLEAGGIFNQKIEEKQIKLNAGDYCLFFSDGLTEAMNVEDELFGEERVEKILEEGNFSSAQELKELLLHDVHEFHSGAPQNDDITLVIIRAK